MQTKSCFEKTFSHKTRLSLLALFLILIAFIAQACVPTSDMCPQDQNPILSLGAETSADGTVLLTVTCSGALSTDLNFIEVATNKNLQILPKTINCTALPTTLAVKIIEGVKQDTLLIIQARVLKLTPTCTSCARQATLLYDAQTAPRSIPDNSLIGTALALLLTIVLISKKTKR